jgi:dUTP pyrophosphatase
MEENKKENTGVNILKIKLLEKDATLPAYAYSGDAAVDLFAVEPKILNPGERVSVRTGIALEIPVGYAGLIWDKSSISMKYGLKTLGGVIDAGYRGEVKVGLVNLSTESYKIQKGDKVAQMILQKVEHMQIKEVDGLESNFVNIYTCA